MAKSNIGFYLVPNTTPTAETAPYTARIMANGVESFEDIANALATQLGLNADVVKLIVKEGITKAIARCRRGETVHFGNNCLRFKAAIRGSVPYEDSPYDTDLQSVEISTAVDAMIGDTLAELEPHPLTTEEIKNGSRVCNLMDVTSQEFGIIDGIKVFEILGNGITVDGEGEGVWILDAKTREIVATPEVDSVSKGQRAKLHLAAALPNGKYYYRVKTKGLLAQETPAVYEKPVTVIGYAPAPEPTKEITVTKVTHSSEVGESYAIGSGFLALKKVNGEPVMGIMTDELDEETVTVVSDTLVKLSSNWSLDVGIDVNLEWRADPSETEYKQDDHIQEFTVEEA